MTEEEREEKKRKKKEQSFWELFFLSMLEKCASVAIETAFNEIFGEPQTQGNYSDIEMALMDQMEGVAEEELQILFSDWPIE